MLYVETLANRVRAALGRSCPVQEKRTFGGITYMVRGKMCVSVGKDRLMCRIDPAVHDVAIQRPGCRTVVMKGREYRGFVHVDREAVRTKGDLDYWVGLARNYNARAEPSTRKHSR